MGAASRTRSHDSNAPSARASRTGSATVSRAMRRRSGSTDRRPACHKPNPGRSTPARTVSPGAAGVTDSHTGRPKDSRDRGLSGQGATARGGAGTTRGVWAPTARMRRLKRDPPWCGGLVRPVTARHRPWGSPGPVCCRDVRQVPVSGLWSLSTMAPLRRPRDCGTAPSGEPQALTGVRAGGRFSNSSCDRPHLSRSPLASRCLR
ncbi:MAG: hypothetical protein QOG95_4554 [Mycobacterium sp.]|jgi:hypothetical protein|nr:hypothetical protein [Mycobacterium sp.]